MKFEPRPGQAVGRIVVTDNKNSLIARPDETKGTTKFVLLDAVGPDMEAKGIRAGDIVVPHTVRLVVLNNGSVRPFLEEADIKLIARDWDNLDDFRVQTEPGSAYVPFDDPKAAAPLGFKPQTGRTGPTGPIGPTEPTPNGVESAP